MAKVLCSCLCLFDAISELYAMNGKNNSMTFSLEKNMDFTCKKGIINS